MSVTELADKTSDDAALKLASRADSRNLSVRINTSLGMDTEEEPDLVIVTTDIPLPVRTSPSTPLQDQDQLLGLRLRLSPVQDEDIRNNSSRNGRFRSIRHRVVFQTRRSKRNMKPNVVVDEMFPEGAGPYVDIDEAGGSSGLLMDLAANEKSVHTDFFNQFEDLYDDEDIS